MAIHAHTNQSTLDAVTIAPKIKVGTISVAASTGNQAFTGVGFQPTAIHLFMLNADSATESIYGAGTGNPTLMFGSYIHGGETSTTGIAIIDWKNDSGIVQLEATINSFDSDGFTLNFTTAATTQTFGYIAYRL